jgi:hypothetical protein
MSRCMTLVFEALYYTHTVFFHNRGFRTLCVDLLVPVLIVQEAGWAPEAVWTQRLDEKSFILYWSSNPGRPVRSQTLY